MSLIKYSMRWSTLKSLLSGLIGNSIFLLSFVSVIAAIPFANIGNLNISIALTGAIILSFAYIANKILMPATIESFRDYREYYAYLKDLNDNNYLSYQHEFSMLENNEEVGKLPIFKDLEFRLHKFEGLDKYKKVIGDAESLYALSIIKFYLIDHSNLKSRLWLTGAFLVGVVFLYFPAALRIVKTIVNGVQ